MYYAQLTSPLLRQSQSISIYHAASLKIFFLIAFIELHYFISFLSIDISRTTSTAAYYYSLKATTTFIRKKPRAALISHYLAMMRLLR